MSLTFEQLRTANARRLLDFPTCADWGLSQWSNATLGELGEAANIIKKIERGDFTLAEARLELGKELADVQTYLDLLAMAIGIDLGGHTIDKFNEVSDRVGSKVRL